MEKHRLSFIKRATAVVACAALAVSLMPAQAFALGEITEWSAPPKSDTSFVKDGKTYTYITSAAHRRCEAVADYLGISNVTVQPMRTGKAFPYQEPAAQAYQIAAQTGRMGIFGTTVNENLNPYYGNFFYNIRQELLNNEDRAADDKVIKFTLENNGPMNADTDVIDAYGTSASLYLRPDILYGAGASGGVVIKDKDTGEEVTAAPHSKATSGYTELVEKIRNGELGEFEGVSLAKDGDASYDPWYVKMSTNTVNKEDIYMLYDLATAAEGIMDATKDTDNPKVTRYGDPMEIAQLYEEWILGTQLAVLKAFDEGKATRKTVGVIENGKINTETGQITFTKEDAQLDHAKTSPYEFLTDVCNNIIDVNKLEAGVGSAKDIMDCSAIFLTSAAQKDQLITVLQANGYTDEKAYPDIYTTGPSVVLNLQHECEANMQYGFLIGFVYPEIINPVDAVAFYYRSFYHIKESKLADALGMQIADMSLPTGVELNLNTYSDEDFRQMLDDAMKYYVKNKAAIVEAHPALTTSEYFDLPSLEETVANEIADEIAALPPVDELTAADADAIAAARAAYENLSDEAKAKVDPATLETLAAAEAAIAEIQKEAKATDDAKAFETLVAALPSTAKMKASDAKAVTAARKAYNALSKEAKAKVNAFALRTLEDAEARAAELASSAKPAAKKAQKITVKTVKKTYKGKKFIKSKKLKKKQSFKIGAKASGKGKLSYEVKKKDPKKMVTFKNGKVTVKKDAKAGTYKVKVKVTAAAKGNYKKATKTVTIKVVVKKK